VDGQPSAYRWRLLADWSFPGFELTRHRLCPGNPQVFRRIITGSGESINRLLRRTRAPLLLLWGDKVTCKTQRDYEAHLEETPCSTPLQLAVPKDRLPLHVSAKGPQAPGMSSDSEAERRGRTCC